jgi:hypothetical protein
MPRPSQGPSRRMRSSFITHSWWSGTRPLSKLFRQCNAHILVPFDVSSSVGGSLQRRSSMQSVLFSVGYGGPENSINSRSNFAVFGYACSMAGRKQRYSTKG